MTSLILTCEVDFIGSPSPHGDGSFLSISTLCGIRKNPCGRKVNRVNFGGQMQGHLSLPVSLSSPRDPDSHVRRKGWTYREGQRSTRLSALPLRT